MLRFDKESAVDKKITKKNSACKEGNLWHYLLFGHIKDWEQANLSLHMVHLPFSKSWTFEIQILKLAGCLQKWIISSLNDSLCLDNLITNQRSYNILPNSAFWGWLSMESQPQNPEFRINPENFHPCILIVLWYYDSKFLTVPLTVSLYLYHPLMWTSIYQFIDINTVHKDDWLISQNQLWQHHETTLSYSTSGENCRWIVSYILVKRFVMGLI